MRLNLLLPRVEPDLYPEPKACPYPGCQGKHFHLRQEVRKALRDTVLHEVVARRYECLRCGRTFRVYPLGVCEDQTSVRLRGIAVMLYILGLSYGAVALVLGALGHPLSKTAVYYAVQAAGERVQGLRREDVRLSVGRALVAALGVDLTTVKCKGEWVTVGVSVDAAAGTTLTVDILDDAEAGTLTAWVQEIADVLGAEVWVSDDADGFKIASDENGLQHQVCKSHVLRNTESWVAEIRPKLAKDADGSLRSIGVTPQQAVADVDELLRLIRERQPGPQAETTLREIHRRYLGAPSPGELHQDHATLAYRLRLFSLDRWNLWRYLTLYRTWCGSDGTRLDGTNNACERAIGSWIKERYRTMRGYKRYQSILNVSRLIVWAGNQLNAGADLASIIA
jgi:transposase-like protein